MNLYILLTVDINTIGGIQAYTAARVEYLRCHGWRPLTIYCGIDSGKSTYEQLRSDTFACPTLSFDPGALPKLLRKLIMDRLVSYIERAMTEEACSRSGLIIESQDSWTAPWGELLASELGCKHFCFLCNEKLYRFNNYTSHRQSLYLFKARRGELACISEKSYDQLFRGCDCVGVKRKVFFAAPIGPIQDVSCPTCLFDGNYRWAIAFISRPQKLYFAFAVEGVREFARRHSDEAIRFVVVGDMLEDQRQLISSLELEPNVTVKSVGSLVPIPRSLFEVVDAVIAGSGCALYSALEGKPVIVPDAKNGKAIGVLGYDTQDSLYSSTGEYREYAGLLDCVLVERVYERLSMDRSFAPVSTDHANDCQMELIAESDPEEEWYGFEGLDNRYDRMGITDTLKAIAKCILLYAPSAGRTLAFLGNAARRFPFELRRCH